MKPVVLYVGPIALASSRFPDSDASCRVELQCMSEHSESNTNSVFWPVEKNEKVTLTSLAPPGAMIHMQFASAASPVPSSFCDNVPLPLVSTPHDEVHPKQEKGYCNIRRHGHGEFMSQLTHIATRHNLGSNFVTVSRSHEETLTQHYSTGALAVNLHNQLKNSHAGVPIMKWVISDDVFWQAARVCLGECKQHREEETLTDERPEFTTGIGVGLCGD